MLAGECKYCSLKAVTIGRVAAWVRRSMPLTRDTKQASVPAEESKREGAKTPRS